MLSSLLRGSVWAVLIGVGLHSVPWESLGESLYPTFPMAAPINKAAFKAKTACVVGGSGEVGKELVRTLLESEVFGGLVLVGRRQLDFAGQDLFKDVQQKVVDFDKLEETGAEAFAGCDVAFCALGTTRGKAGADGFYKVDHDYVMSVARLSKAPGVRHFSLVSSKGADKNSWFLYPKTKGEVEAEIGELGFERYSIFRPACLMCDRVEHRGGEKLIRGILRPVAAMCPTWITIPTTWVAQAMVRDLWGEAGAPKGDVYENPKCHELAANFRQAFAKE